MLKSNISKKSNVPMLIWILLAAVAFFSTVNLLQDTSNWSFSEISGVFAQFVRTAPNTGRLVTQLATSEGFEDQSDRCEIIDPNRPTIETAGELNASDTLQLLGENMAGANPGIDITGGYGSDEAGKVWKYAQELGMSYSIAIVTDETGVSGAVEFIDDSYDHGLIPIVRLCYRGQIGTDGGCGFKTKEEIIYFYSTLNGLANNVFIAMLGPNEPGTNAPGEKYELEGFFDAEIGISDESYAKIIEQTNDIAEALQSYRYGSDGGKMLLSPGAFNLNNVLGRDTYQYLYNTNKSNGEEGVINPEYYDYLMGNVYALGYDRVSTASGANITQTYSWYRDGDMNDGQSLGNYAEEHGLQVIITEFGIIRNNGGPHSGNDAYLIQEAVDSFKLFCKDDTVQGVLFFRSFLDNQGNKIMGAVEEELGLTQAQHAQIIGDCVKASPYKDWSWANCNFDSCQYQHTYDDRSVATVCGAKDADQIGDGRPALKANCSGGICQTKAIGTIDVSMPIKHFGGNTIAGTPQLPYSSICAEVAKYVNDSKYDALNQFAGVLTTNGSTQSGINSRGGNISYNIDSEEKGPSIMVVGDSLSSDTRFAPNSLFTSVNKTAAIGGSNARQYAGQPTTEYPINRSSELSNAISQASGDGVTEVFITLGTNQCGEGSAAVAAFQDHMRSIINSIRSGIPSANIHIFAIPYYDEQLSIQTYGFACDKATVDLYNSQLINLGVSVHNIHTDFGVSTSGHTTDGIHLNDESYLLWNAGVYSIATGKDIPAGASSVSQSNTIGNSSNNYTYSMPWLGSAINCASQLILYSTDFSRLTENQLDFNPNIGSLFIENKYEITQSTLKGSNWETLLGISGNALIDVDPDKSSRAIQDEKTVCQVFDNGEKICYDKASDSDKIQQIQQYDPFKSTSLWEQATCSNDVIFRDNEANYITGPEIVVTPERVVDTMSSSQLCYEFSKRHNGENSNIIAGYDYPSLVEGPTQEKLRSITPACAINTNRVLTINNTPVYCAYAGKCTAEDAYLGKCNINSIFTNCFDYINESENANHEIYYKANSSIYPSIPQYQIPGMYDALHRLYQRVQTTLSQRGLKIVFRENVGIETRVNAKIRDASRTLSDSLNANFPAAEFSNLYAQETQSCLLQDNSYDYTNLLAKNAPVKTQYQYYEWLGYLDILQEVSSAYLYDKDLSDAQLINNPTFGMEDAPNSDREKYLQGGSAHKALSFPIFTCDEVEFRKYVDEKFSLYGIFDGKITCLTTLDDNRFEDELGEYLCSRGYEVEGLCDESAFCKVPTITSYELSGRYNGVTCPLEVGEHACFQGPKGDYTHCKGNTETYPLDLFPAFPAGRDSQSDNDNLSLSEQKALRSLNVYAPESGKVVSYESYANTSYGDLGETVGIRGSTTGITYYISHLQKGTFTVGIGDSVTAGQVIAEICTTCAYNYKNWHIHISASIGKDPVDPYLVYGEILGCRAKRPPEGAKYKENVGYGGYCAYNGVLLNDNANCPKDLPTINNSLVIQRYESLGVNDGTSSPVVVVNYDNNTDTNQSICTTSLDISTGPYKDGVLSCQIDLSNIGQQIDWQSWNSTIEARIRSYHDVDTYAWIANPQLDSESESLKNILVQQYGSEEEYLRKRQERVDMTKFLVNRSIELGLNPRFTVALWIEESGTSSVARLALGCGVSSEMPEGDDVFDQMKAHLEEQLQCINYFTQATNSFDQFMCTYSGEPASPVSSVKSVEIDGVEVLVRDCNTSNFTTNKYFPTNLCKFYNYIDPWQE